MLTSTRRSISYPNTTRVDAPDIPAHIKNLVDALDIDVFYGSGPIASRPVSTAGSPGIMGRLYWATDTQTLDWDYGTGWVTLYPQTGVSVPIGGAIDWDYAAAGIPSWALLQYGQAINRTTYATLAALAAAASYPHGAGDGSTTFNLADKRGRATAGKDDMGGVTASRITAAISGTAGTVLGAAVGNEGVTLSTGQIPSHNHSVTGAPSRTGSATLSGSVGFSDPGHRHNLRIDNGSSGSPSYRIATRGAGSDGYLDQDTDSNVGLPHLGNSGTGISVNNGSLAVSDTISITVGSLGTGNTGSGGVHLNTQPTIIVNKIIRAL